MYGSAAVIGLQMLPILEPLTPEAGARARALGEAFQMSNFIRDVGEDLKRGRVYLPQEDLDTFGVTRAALARGSVTPLIRELLAFEIERTRAMYAFAEPGIDMLHPTSPRLHADGVHPLRRDPRRGRARRLPGADPAGERAAVAAARGGGPGRAARAGGAAEQQALPARLTRGSPASTARRRTPLRRPVP